jgi:outer membrane cobalamin receptor
MLCDPANSLTLIRFTMPRLRSEKFRFPGARSVVIATLLSLPAFSLEAQQRDSAARVDSIRKRATRIDPIVVTATINPAPIGSAGIQTTVVSTANRATIGHELSDALRLVPGAFVDLAAGPGGPAIVRLRGGEEVFTQLLADGVKLNDNGGFFDMQGIELGTVERVEIVPGPQSALYGSSAMSGVVQLLSSAGVPGVSTYRASIEGGSARMRGTNYRGSAAVSGGSGRIGYSLAGEYGYDRGIYDIPHDVKSASGLARIDAALTPRSALTGIVRYFGVDANLPVRDPGATRVPLDPDAMNTRDRWVTSLQATSVQGRTTHRLRGSRFDRTFVYNDKRNNVAPEGTYPFFVFDATFRLRSVLQRTTLDYTGTTRLPDAGSLTGLAISYGALWERESLRDRTSGEFGDGDQKLSQSSGAGFVEIQARPFPRLSVLAGARAEKFEKVDPEIVPRGSLAFDVVPGQLALRASAGRAYKAPNLQDVFVNNPFIESNPSLGAETSVSYEVGADASLMSRMITGGLTYFRQRYDNLIRNVPFEGTDRSINRNLGRSRAHGIEATVGIQPQSGWEIGAKGGWTRTEIIDNSGLSSDQYPEGEELPFRPSYTAAAFLRVPVLGRGAITARGIGVGKQTVLTERFSGSRVTLPGYGLLSLIGEAAVTSRATGYVRVDNVLDRQYHTAFDRPAQARAVTIGISIREGDR